jgi:predicted RNA binding protein YcfA (HicA-like mRNA interferase family)
MGQKAKLLLKLLSGRSDSNLSFDDIVRLLGQLGFTLRVKGSHHIFTRDGVDEIINLQPKGSLAKPYQVKQVRELILKHHLADELDP